MDNCDSLGRSSLEIAYQTLRGLISGVRNGLVVGGAGGRYIAQT